MLYTVALFFCGFSILYLPRVFFTINKKNKQTNREEAQEYIEIGTINGLFVLGRCTGFIGKSGAIHQCPFHFPCVSISCV